MNRRPTTLPLSDEQKNEWAELHHTTRVPRLQTRGQIILLAAEKQVVAREIAEIVCMSDQAVRTRLKRYQTEGGEGLKDTPRACTPTKGTAKHADFMAGATDIRVDPETVRIYLKKQDRVLYLSPT